MVAIIIIYINTIERIGESENRDRNYFTTQ